MEALIQVIHSQLEGKGLSLQVDGECFCWRRVSEALLGLDIEIACQAVEGTLRYADEVGVSKHETRYTLVGDFNTAFLPWRARIAGQAAGAYSLRRLGKLGASIKRRARTRHRWQGLEGSDYTALGLNTCAITKRAIDTATMQVDIAAIVGSTWSRSALNIFRFKVPPVPVEMNIATMTSSSDT